jgi:hypothetical protein
MRRTIFFSVLSLSLFAAASGFLWETNAHKEAQAQQSATFAAQH